MPEPASRPQDSGRGEYETGVDGGARPRSQEIQYQEYFDKDELLNARCIIKNQKLTNLMKRLNPRALN